MGSSLATPPIITLLVHSSLAAGSIDEATLLDLIAEASDDVPKINPSGRRMGRLLAARERGLRMKV